jgi:hypothetical protein
MVQLAYTSAPAKAVAGMPYDTAVVRDTLSKAAETGFPPGILLVYGAAEDVCTPPRIVDVDAIITNIASAATPQTLSGASLNGVIGDAAVNPSAKLNLVLSSHADWDATTAVVTGKRNGVTITENFAIPNGGNATVAGTKVFDDVTSILIPAQSGTGGTATLGVQGNYDTGDIKRSAIGIAWYDATKETGPWEVQDMVPVMHRGRIWVPTERVVASSSQQLGALRGTADSGNAILIPQLRWFIGATAGNLAVVECSF